MEVITPILPHINTNIYDSDWMLITILILSDNVNSHELLEKIKNGSDLRLLFNNLKNEQKEIVIKSLINYAISTDEEHLIFQDFI